MQASEFLDAAANAGYQLLCGVPCSYLTPFLNAALNQQRIRHLGASSEGEAVGIAIGHWLGGGQAIVYAQNSGLGNMVNPLTSLAQPMAVPLLLLLSWRGDPRWPDEPQHQQMGRIMHQMLDLLEIPHQPFPQDADALANCLQQARQQAEQGARFALVLQKDSLPPQALQPQAGPRWRTGSAHDWRFRPGRQYGAQLLTRLQALQLIRTQAGPQAVLLASTGMTGRELFALGDSANQLYCVGGMGCASAIGLGLAQQLAQNAMHQSDQPPQNSRPVLVLDGDGAALMKLGNLAGIGLAAPPQLLHIVLNNGVHDSTGGQASNAAQLDFARIALACGYASAHDCDDASGLRAALEHALASPGPHLLHLRITPGSMANPPRPDISPQQVAQRLRRYLQENP